MSSSISLIRVRYQETDQMNVVYHANYLTWFEIGRTDYIRERGFSYQRLEGQGVLLPVIEVQCRYLRPARYDEEIEIHTFCIELTGSKIVFDYQAKRTDGNLLAKGTSKHLFTTQDMKRINIKSKLPEVYERLISKG